MKPSVLHRCIVPAVLLAFAAQASQAGDDSKATVGIPERVPWTTSQMTGSPDPPAPYAIEWVFPNLKFKNPTLLTDAPGTERLFVAELEGKIFSLLPGNDVAQAELFFDMGQHIEGVPRVYGLAFHPRFQHNRHCYICYIVAPDKPNGTRVARFQVQNSDPPVVDPASEQILFTWRSGGHNGGCLKFGPDGYLYISTGDGGPAFPPDPLKSGQDVSNLLSSILRIDVDSSKDGKPYAIPHDNPFVELDGARGEVWSYGYRNPWKMSFDRETGDLWVGDVGWELWEMIYRVERGGNYGWSLVEGQQPVHRERTRGPTPILRPTIEHSHIEARSITGGFVYRGQRLKELVGTYVYGDYVTGKIWGARHDGSQVTSLEELVDTSLQIICFGVDHVGELYIVGYDGTMHRLVRQSMSDVNRDFPRRLCDTGLFARAEDHEVAPGVIPYSINAEPWGDHTISERFVALPGASKLGVYKESNAQIGYLAGHWKFPNDSVLAKTISLETQRGDASTRRRLETQILHRHEDTWRAYSYIWNDDQTDAVLADDVGQDRTFTIEDPAAPGGQSQQTYHFSSRSECLLCHTTRGGSIYGFKIEQLNKDHEYDGIVADQLRTLEHIGLFDQSSHESTSKIVSPYGESAGLAERARAYLHVNCAHCHRRGGGGTAVLEVQHDLPLARTNLLGARPTQGTFGIHGAEILAPGDPYRSVLYYRMAKTGPGRMPYFGSSVVDERGLKLIHDWIAGLEHPSAPPEPGDSASGVATLSRAALDKLSAPDVTDSGAASQVKQLLSTTSGALLLAHAVTESSLDTNIEAVVLAQVAEATDLQIRDLFERFLPEDQRVKRLGAVVNADQILSLRGNALRGRKLFMESDSVQCKSCHRVGPVGQQVGPDLHEIGKKYDRARLLESILKPSKSIDPRFVTHVIETKDGQVLTGLLVTKDEKQGVLKDGQNRLVRVPASQIEFLAPQQKSLMPELLLQDMTAEQVADLLEFLASL